MNEDKAKRMKNRAQGWCKVYGYGNQRRLRRNRQGGRWEPGEGSERSE